MYFYLAPSFLLGWALGRNNSANIFGPSAIIGLISYKKAKILATIFVFMGAIVGGSAGLKTIGSLGSGGILGSSLALLSASISIITMTQIGLPVSTSQAVAGGVIEAGLARGTNLASKKVLTRIFLGWIETPVIPGIVVIILYKILRREAIV